MTIRDATPNDLPSIGRIYVLGHWAAYRGHVPISNLRAMDATVEAASFAPELNNPNATFLVAINSRARVVGFALGGPTGAADPTLAGLAELFVERQYWGRGPASLLLQALSQRMAASGMTRMKGPVAIVNARSRAFCQKHGAHEVNNGDWFAVFGNVAGFQPLNLNAVWEEWAPLP